MQKGKIVSLGDRRSGFIKRPKIKEDLFFHEDNLTDVSFGELKVGDKLSFSVQETKNGPYATSVRRI